MSKLTEFDGGEEFTASDEEIEAALERTADELNVDVETVEEGAAHMLDSGTGVVTNEAVGGPASVSNPDAADDPRLEAIELFRMQATL